MRSFTTTIYRDYEEPEIFLNNFIVYLLWLAFFLVVLILPQLGIRLPDWFIFLLCIVALPSPLIFYFASFLFEVEHTKTIIGEIAFTPDFINWNEEIIEWEQIDKVELTLSDYQGRKIFRSKYDYGNTKSAGLENVIFIKTKEGVEYVAHLLIRREHLIDELDQFFWRIVKEKNISRENAENLLHLKNYKDFQRLKEYIKK